MSFMVTTFALLLLVLAVGEGAWAFNVTMGVDSSIPPFMNSWHLAKAYFPLSVQNNVAINFAWIGEEGLAMTTDKNDYLKCLGNATVIVPPGSPAGSYTFHPNATGTFYFYNPESDGLYCRAGQKTQVSVFPVNGIKCSSAKTKLTCSLLSQCSFKLVRKRRRNIPTCFTTVVTPKKKG